MLKMLKGASAAALALALMAGAGAAEGLKAAADVKIAVVVHGASSDAYWSVVKRGWTTPRATPGRRCSTSRRRSSTASSRRG